MPIFLVIVVVIVNYPTLVLSVYLQFCPSCFLNPMSKNSVLEELIVRKLAVLTYLKPHLVHITVTPCVFSAGIDIFLPTEISGLTRSPEMRLQCLRFFGFLLFIKLFLAKTGVCSAHY